MTVKTPMDKAESWVPREDGVHTNPVGGEVGVILPALLHLTVVNSGHAWAVQARSIGFARHAITEITERTFLSTIDTGEVQFHKAMGHGMTPKQVNTFERSHLVRC